MAYYRMALIGAACGIFLFPVMGHSATFTSFAQLGSLGCEESESNSFGATSTCGSIIVGSLDATSNARSQLGTVSARASSVYSRNQDGALRADSGLAKSSATFTDGIRATYSDTGEAFNGTISVSLDLLGGVTTVGDSLNGFVSSTFFVNNTQLFSYDSALSALGPDAVTTVSSVIIAGNFSIFASASAQARVTLATSTDGLGCQSTLTPVTCYVDNDLGSSLRITGLTFLDENENDVTGLLDVISESGFDYITGAAPHDRGDSMPAVPLPSSIGFLALGLVGLGAMRRRAKDRVA